MSDKTITGEELKLSKKAYLTGFVNHATTNGKSPEDSVAMAKKASAHREELYNPETQVRLEKRASELKDVLLSRAKEEKAA